MSLKLSFNDLHAKSVCLMLLSSKYDESDGIKTFVVYSSYITLPINIFKQKKNKNVNLCYGLYRRKSVTF